MARAALHTAGRRFVLHPARSDPRTVIGPGRRPRAATRPSCSRGVRRRFAPHQLRHAHAVEMSREGVPLLVIQRQLGHPDLAIRSVYLRGIDTTEILHAVHERPAPMIPAHNGLRPSS